MTKNSNIGLGRGLGAILPDREIQENQGEIGIDLISPNPMQPRTDFSQEALEELAESVKTYGIIQPITVMAQPDGRFTIISGERRWRAAQMAGLDSVPAFIREADDQDLQEMALVENIQRQDLNALEIAISLQRLLDEYGVTQETIAARVGKKRSTIANYLRLLSLPEAVQKALKENLITMGHAKAIASAPEEICLQVLRRCIAKGLSVRATEELVRALTERAALRTESDEELPEIYTHAVESLSRILTENISIQRDRNGHGKIIIRFSDDDELQGILDRTEGIISQQTR